MSFSSKIKIINFSGGMILFIASAYGMEMTSEEDSLKIGEIVKPFQHTAPLLRSLTYEESLARIHMNYDPSPSSGRPIMKELEGFSFQRALSERKSQDLCYMADLFAQLNYTPAIIDLISFKINVGNWPFYEEKGIERTVEGRKQYWIAELKRKADAGDKKAQEYLEKRSKESVNS